MLEKLGCYKIRRETLGYLLIAVKMKRSPYIVSIARFAEVDYRRRFIEVHWSLLRALA